MGSIGHPIVDIAQMCVLASIGYCPTSSESILTKLYAEQRGLSLPLPHWDFIKALIFFRDAAVIQVCGL